MPQSIDDNTGLDEFWEEEGMVAPACLHILYEDSDGNETERTVDVLRFAETAWGDQLIGRCHTRNALRTFSLDRIIDCQDASTGQSVDDVYSFLSAIHQTTPEYAFTNLLIKHLDTLRAVLYLAACAGYTDQEKARIILQISRQLAREPRIPESSVKRLISDFEGDPITGVDQTFRLIAGRLGKAHSKENRDSIMQLCQKVASLKGPVTAASQECLEYLAKRFKEQS